MEAAEAWERGARAVTQTVEARMGAAAPAVEAPGFCRMMATPQVVGEAAMGASLCFRLEI